MKSGTKHLSPFARQFPVLPQIETIGYLPEKKDCINFSFDTCNFSFILSGGGTYLLRGKLYPVTAPAVLLQWPGEPMLYGPREGGSWEELYLIYPGSCQTALLNTNTFLPDTFPVRPFARTPRFESALARLKAFVASRRIQETDGDTGDLLCWELIASSFARPEERAAENVRLKRIREYLEKNLSKDIHLETLASELRMSVSSLRRCWYGGAGNTTFREYRDEIFLQKSCRLLVESRDSVKEIASALGFDDIYYFSRKFHHLSGMTASAYRRKYCIPPLVFPGAAPERR